MHGSMTTSPRTRRKSAPASPTTAPDVGTPVPAASITDLHGAASYLPQVLPVFEKLSALLGRPARVLDLGPDRDYFAHHLGARGASVTAGRFHELAAAKTAANTYDLVLCLGTRLLAQPVDRPLLETLGHCSGVLLADSSAIESAHSALSGVFSFAHDVPPAGRGQHPICFASNRYWFLGDTMAAFETYTSDPHPMLRGIHLGSRRFYVGSGVIAKVYETDQPGLPRNRIEWENETRYLRDVPPGMSAPALMLSGEHNREAWLVREHIEGRALLDLIEDGSPYDPGTILRDLLVELAALEQAGLYHRDVRSWNVIVRPNGRATLIDYGAIWAEPRSSTAPLNPFPSFMLFANEVFSRASLWGHAGYSPKFRLDLAEPFGGAFRAMLLTPPAQWSFAGLLRNLDASPSGPAAATLPPGVDVLLAAAGECGDAFTARLSVLAEKVNASRTYEEQLNRANRRVSAQAEALITVAQCEAELRQRADLADATIASMRGSTSWRVTAPLRAVVRMIRRMTGRP
jgi:hypothetical protein